MIERVHYFDGQFLRRADFEAEQCYQIGMRRRHNIAHHSSGIVGGLEPCFVDGVLWVKPGFAVDVFGREVILSKSEQLPVELFANDDETKLEVWIEYSTTATTSPPPGYETADGEFYRIAEIPRVWLSKATAESALGPSASADPLEKDFDATSAPPPEDHGSPIFLGTITLDPKDPKAPYRVNLSGRIYAGLIGEKITAPSGRARVQIGTENPKDPLRFAVFIPANSEEPALEIQQDGKMAAHGETTVEGNLTVNGGGLELGAGPVTSAQPWRIYRVSEQDQDGKFHDSLRVEMAEGKEGGNNQIVFGAWSAKDKKFKPSLTIEDNGNVTVSGNLMVQGRLEVNPEEIVGKHPTGEVIVPSGVVGSAVLPAEEPPAITPPRLTEFEKVEDKFHEVLKHLEHPEHVSTFLRLLKAKSGNVALSLKREIAKL